MSGEPTPRPCATMRPLGAAPAPQSFIEEMQPHAQVAAAATGIPARFILAQAALESGWGRNQIRRADGTPSCNLFGIKAGAGWSGKTVEVPTTEYVDGAPRQLAQRFRAYDSYAEAFADWARLAAGAARYAAVAAAGTDATAYAQALQSAGYATDPAYAAKLTRVLDHAALKPTAA